MCGYEMGLVRSLVSRPGNRRTSFTTHTHIHLIHAIQMQIDTCDATYNLSLSHEGQKPRVKRMA